MRIRGKITLTVAVAVGLVLGTAVPASAATGTYYCTGTRIGAAVISAAGGGVVAFFTNGISVSQKSYILKAGVNTYMAHNQVGHWTTGGGTVYNGGSTCLA